MRKIITWLIAGGTAIVATVGLMAAPSSASANGVDPETLGNRWSCQDVVHAVHCVPPGVAGKIGTTPAFPTLVFDNQDSAFLGTEFNIRGDLFREGRPCPTDTGEYTYLPDIHPMLPDYYACHRFLSGL
jgi:hypothetical protein